jgi:transposase
MTHEDQISSPKGDKHARYKKLSDIPDKNIKYAEKDKMFPVDDTPKPYDQYEDLVKFSKRFFKIVEPAVKDLQAKVEDYENQIPIERKSYPQDWRAYNQAQMKEKTLLITILNELLDHIPFQEVHSVGRLPIPTRDKIFYLTLQAYNVKSSRRCVADLDLCRQLGFVRKTPHFNTVLKCLNDPILETYFKHLINVSGLPLQQVETDFAVDSTGFSTSQFERWFDVRIGKESDKRRFRKCHLTCGVKTNIITSVNITSAAKGDAPQFADLVENTKRIFDIKEVSADKAYSSRQNLAIVSQLGGIAYIPFRSNMRGTPRGPWIWRTMFDLYTAHREDFMSHYHKRSNVESVFHMLKNKFSDYIRSKHEVSQNNEILAKCLAHNICVLVQEMLELGIEINFEKCADFPIAPK